MSLGLAQRVMFKIHQSIVPKSAGDRKICAKVLAKLLRGGSTLDGGFILLKVRFKFFYHGNSDTQLLTLCRELTLHMEYLVFSLSLSPSAIGLSCASL